MVTHFLTHLSFAGRAVHVKTVSREHTIVSSGEVTVVL